MDEMIFDISLPASTIDYLVGLAVNRPLGEAEKHVNIMREQINKVHQSNAQKASNQFKTDLFDAITAADSFVHAGAEHKVVKVEEFNRLKSLDKPQPIVKDSKK